VTTVDKYLGSDEASWVHPTEWRELVLRHEELNDGETVYYRDKLPLRETQVSVQTNIPVECDAMYFEHRIIIGRIVAVSLIFCAIVVLVALVWCIVRKDIVGATFITGTFATIPLAMLSVGVIVLLNEEGK